MSLSSRKMKRRTVLKGIAAIPVIAVSAYPGFATAEMLRVDDPIARNFNYTETSPYPDKQTCSNCRLYTGGPDPIGGCPLFGNKQVVAGGWCSAWVAK